MFKIIVFNSDAPGVLEDLQTQYDILEVRELGFDSQNKYLLIQYANKAPTNATSGSLQAAKK